MEKQNKTKPGHTTTKKKQDHKMQTRKPLSLVCKKRKQTTQTQNNATSLFRLQTNNTRNKGTKTQNIKNYLLTNITLKTPELQGNVFHRLKAKQETRQKQNKNKTRTLPKVKPT